MAAGLAPVDARFGHLEKAIETLFDLATTTERRIVDLEMAIEKRTGNLMRWSFALWIGVGGDYRIGWSSAIASDFVDLCRLLHSILGPTAAPPRSPIDKRTAERPG